MAGAARGGEREAEHALLARADAVVAAAVELERLAGALVDHHVAGAPCPGAARTASGRRSSAPVSSSAVNTSISSPASGRQPSSASASAAAASAATWLFMSSAPRPQTQPSRSSPDQGSTRPLLRVREHGVHVAEQAQPSGRRSRSRSRATRLGRPSTAASSSHSKPASSSSPLRNSCAACSLPGGLTVLKRIRRCSSSVVRPSSCARSGTRSSMQGTHHDPPDAPALPGTRGPRPPPRAGDRRSPRAARRSPRARSGPSHRVHAAGTGDHRAAEVGSAQGVVLRPQRLGHAEPPRPATADAARASRGTRGRRCCRPALPADELEHHATPWPSVSSRTRSTKLSFA